MVCILGTKSEQKWHIMSSLQKIKAGYLFSYFIIIFITFCFSLLLYFVQIALINIIKIYQQSAIVIIERSPFGHWIATTVRNVHKIVQERHFCWSVYLKNILYQWLYYCFMLVMVYLHLVVNIVPAVCNGITIGRGSKSNGFDI